MDRRPACLQSQASSLTTSIPGNLIPHYVAIAEAGISPWDAAQHLVYITTRLNHRQSTSTLDSLPSLSSTSSSQYSSNRNSLQSFVSSNSSASHRPRLGSIPEVGFSINASPKIEEEETVPKFRGTSKGYRRRASTQSSNVPKAPQDTTNVKPYVCPWCEVRCNRPHDYKVHIKKRCGSQEVYICLGCGYHAQSQQVVRDHCDSNSTSNCKTLRWQESMLGYNRRAYGCRHTGLLFSDLKEYITHLILNCSIYQVEGKGEQSVQIRALLRQHELREQADNLCRIKWGAHSVKDLWWDYSRERMAKIVEKLEYGIVDVDEGDLNLGIPSDEVDAFLRKLINDSTLVQHADNHPLPPLPRQQRATMPASAFNRIQKRCFVESQNSGSGPWQSLDSTKLHEPKNISGWLQDTSTTTHDASGNPLLSTTRDDTAGQFVSDLEHRPKWPVPDAPAPHLTSMASTGPNALPQSVYDHNNPGLTFVGKDISPFTQTYSDSSHTMDWTSVVHDCTPTSATNGPAGVEQAVHPPLAHPRLSPQVYPDTSFQSPTFLTMDETNFDSFEYHFDPSTFHSFDGNL